MDDADVVAQPLDDLEDVRGEEDRAAAFHERGEQVLDLPRRDGVDALERLVEEQQPRGGQQRRRERDLLAHAVRVVRDEACRRRAPRSITASSSLERALSVARGDAVDLPTNASVSAPRQPIEQREVFGHDADRALDATGSAADPGPGCGTCRPSRPEQAGQALDRRGLPRAVRARGIRRSCRAERRDRSRPRR